VVGAKGVIVIENKEDEMNKLLITSVVLLSTQNTFAKESTAGLNINSPKEALQLISTDSFGKISLKSLIGDIKGDEVYRERTKYSSGQISIQSQNDYGHYGNIEFEFKPPHNVTKQDVIVQSAQIKGVKVTDSGSRVYLRWQSNDFKCSLDFDSDAKYPLFQYLCNYSEK